MHFDINFRTNSGSHIHFQITVLRNQKLQVHFGQKSKSFQKALGAENTCSTMNSQLFFL